MDGAVADMATGRGGHVTLIQYIGERRSGGHCSAFGVRPNQLRPSQADARNDGFAAENDGKRTVRYATRPWGQVGAVFDALSALSTEWVDEKDRGRGRRRADGRHLGLVGTAFLITR
jgi:hypothetical protein